MFYRAGGSSRRAAACDPQFAIEKRTLQSHMQAVVASLAEAPCSTSLLSPLPLCKHPGHALRIAALLSLRAILLRHCSLSLDVNSTLRSDYRLWFKLQAHSLTHHTLVEVAAAVVVASWKRATARRLQVILCNALHMPSFAALSLL
jgi:hypothetical protein